MSTGSTISLDPRRHFVPTPGNRLAIRLYRTLEQKVEADLLHVFSAIERSRAPMFSLAATDAGPVATGQTDEQTDARTRASRDSLAAAAVALGEKPSRRKYDAWRDAQPNRDAYVPAVTIRRVFGTWGQALESLGGPRADVTARRLLSNGKRFTREECEQAIELFLAETASAPGRRTIDEYQRWAYDYARTTGAARVPLWAKTICRHLETDWLSVLSTNRATDSGGSITPQGDDSL